MVARGAMRKKEINKQSTGDIQESENSLCGATMVNICHYIFAQTHRIYNTKSEP